MATQEIFRDLDVPLYRSKMLFCGECAERRPYEELHPIGKAGGQHFERKTFELREFDTVDVEPGFFSSLELGDNDDVDGSADWWTKETLNKIRPGLLYGVVKNAPRIDYDAFAADVAERQPQKDPKKLDEIIKEQLGYQRSTVSPGHLALFRLDDDEPGSVLTCWKCGTKMSVGRGHLVKAVEYCLEFGGDILVLRGGIKVRDSEVSFEKKPHRRKKPAPPPPVSFRRGSDFVASGFVPE